eukprot:2142817-Prymnesium_polylepis.1
MPAWAILAAATNVGDRLDAAASEPRGADRARIARGEGDLEAAVAVEQRGVGAVEGHALRPEQEVGHLRAVGARREMLGTLEPRGVEEGGRLLERLARRAGQ